MQEMARKVLLVGSGITAAVTGALLRKKLKDHISLTIWDKARGAGGRMSTSRSPGDAECTADLGAQYITVSPENFEKNRYRFASLLLISCKTNLPTVNNLRKIKT